MDKFEYKVRADEIKELIDRGDYIQAAEIADTIDWRRVKSVMMLCTISDLYKINRRYEDARDMLLLAYERRPGARTICYSLCELSIKMEEYVAAVEFYKEFVQVAPKDSGRYILQYKLYEAQDVSLEERIAVLEELKARDYREKWAYELAYLYHRVGLATKCVEECDELILWFGDGKYVFKAMELKMLHQPLTEDQKRKYDGRFAAYTEQEEAAQTQEEVPVDQEEIREEELQNPEETGEESLANNAGETPEEEDEIHVKTVDVGEYNTINLQAELAAGLREVLAKEQSGPAIADPVMRSIVAPLLDSDTESLDYPEIDEVSEDDLEPEEGEVESSEVFFGETVELSELPPQLLFGKEEKTVSDATAELVMEQLRMQTEQENMGEQEAVLRTEPPKELAGVLSQDSDGQLSFVVPEKTDVEEQITGQLSISDILLEWERIKKENQQKREEQLREHVLQQTGNLFTEFEAAMRDGLLEKLEREKLDDEEIEELPEEDLTEEIPEDSVEEVAEETTQEVVEEAAFEEVAEEDLSIEEIPAQEEGLALEEMPAQEEAETVEAGEEDSAEDGQEEFLVEDGVIEWESLEAEPEAFSEEADETVEMTDGEETWEDAGDGVEEEIEEIETEVSEEMIPEQTTETVVNTEESGEEMVFEELEETDASEEEEEEHPAEAPEKAEKSFREVRRENSKVRDGHLRTLTREERQIYRPYIQTRSTREQLIAAIDGISLAAYTGNVLITGEEGVDTLTLAKNLILEYQGTDDNFTGKVAKISGSTLNRKNVADTLNELKSGAMIVAKASEINGGTAEEMYRMLQQEDLGIVLVFEDTKDAMDKFLAKNAELASCFSARVDVEALDNRALVAFAKQYAVEQEYFIDELGILALHRRLDELQTMDHNVTTKEVQEIVDDAIWHVNRKTMGHFFDILFGKRYNEEDMIILSEKDFD